MSNKSVADELRLAAQRISDVAEAATPGPWINLDRGDRIIADTGEFGRPVYVVDEPLIENPDNGEHIALWGPDVAVLVAHWLDVARERWESDPLAISEEECEEIYQPAIALARAINRSAS
jgi:hypothetical protein